MFRYLRWVYVSKYEVQLAFWSRLISTASMALACVVVAAWLVVHWDRQSSGGLADEARLLDALEAQATALVSINDRYARAAEQRTGDDGSIRAVAEKVDARLESINRNLNGIQVAIDNARKTTIELEIIGFVTKRLKELGEDANPVNVAKQIGRFLADRGVKAADTITEELTKKVLCSIASVACDPVVTVHSPITISSPPINITMPPPSVLGPPTTIVVEKIASMEKRDPVAGQNPELQIFTSAWFGRSNSVDDGGTVERAIIPKIKEQIGGRRDCTIFVSGSADAAGKDDYNKDLSLRRARVVYNSLTKQFGSIVSADLGAHGERNLYNWTVDGESSVYNRRVDIRVLCR